MGRARGADVLHDVAFEATYGAPPASGYLRLPLVTSQLGATQGLIEDDRIGKGREGYDPSQDVINNDGEHVVPVDDLAFGHWLKLYFGAPDSTDNEDGTYTHVFTSGGVLPSAAIQFGHPKVPRYFMNGGVKGNTMQIALSRSGLLNASLGLIAQGESNSATSGSGSPTALSGKRFPQAIGDIKLDGSALGNVVSGQLTYSNNLEKVEVIRADRMIAGADEGVAMANGSIKCRFDSMAQLDAASQGTPIALTFGWALGGHSLLFSFPRVFLPVPKKPIEGPNGIQAQFDFQGSGDQAAICTATLINTIASY